MAGHADHVPALDVRLDLPQAFFIQVDDQHLAALGGVDLGDRLPLGAGRQSSVLGHRHSQTADCPGPSQKIHFFLAVA